jgi:hypothetical protein
MSYFSGKNNLYLDFYSASSLKQRYMYRQVAVPRHIVLILSQPDFALIIYNAACLAEMPQITSEK